MRRVGMWLAAVVLVLAVSGGRAGAEELSLSRGEQRALAADGASDVKVANPEIVDGKLAGSQLLLSGVHDGTTTVTLRGKGGDRQLSVRVAGGVNDDIVIGTTQSATVRTGGRARVVVADGAQVTSDSPATASVAASGTEVFVIGKAEGSTTLRIAGPGWKMSLPVRVVGEPLQALEPVVLPVGAERRIDVSQPIQIEVDNPRVAEVRLLGETAVAVRGLSAGQTVVHVKSKSASVVQVSVRVP